MKRSSGTLRLQILAHAYRQSGALNAAIRLDVFTVIAQGIGEISLIAQEIGVSQQDAQKLVDVLSSLELLEYRDGLYYNAPDVERYLVKGGSHPRRLSASEINVVTYNLGVQPCSRWPCAAATSTEFARSLWPETFQ